MKNAGVFGSLWVSILATAVSAQLTAVDPQVRSNRLLKNYS
jgi:hypothetical protein